MHLLYLKLLLCTVVVPLFLNTIASAQFLETFDGDPTAEWRTATGDGDAVSSIELRDGCARIVVDATNDRRNIWWAIMQTTVSDELDLEQLAQPGYELRVETRIRSSHAPRRVNLHFNTQRTVDFHTHLMEFDIPDTINWHTISMTTRNFDAKPGDTVNAHIALMDWGREIYWIDLDYFKVDVVDKQATGPDYGEQVLYPPPVPEPDQFSIMEPAWEAGMIDRKYPDVNLSGWSAGETPVLTTDETKIIILRWNLDEYHNRNAAGYGMLELTVHSLYKTTGTGLHEFDKVRLVEILGGDPEWNRDSVTLHNFAMGQPLSFVLNTQMIIDIEIQPEKGRKKHIHIPRPVIQRMLEGTTRGIALYPLGALQASFNISNERSDTIHPRLYLDLDD